MSEDQPGPFSPFDAAVWTAGTTFVFVLMAGLVHGDVRPIDTVKLAAVQVAVYLSACSLFSWRRPGKNFSELFGLRRTSPWLFVLCLLLGPALVGPVETLSRLVEHFAPMSPKDLQEQVATWQPTSVLHGTLLMLLLAVGGPLGEELLFRGAIYTALRSAFSAASALWTATLCFTLAHPSPRDWLLILLPALVLSLVRARSGSLWPSFLAHFGFNAFQLALVWKLGGTAVDVPLGYEIGSWLLAAAVLGAVLLIAHRSRLAQEARSVDQSALPAGLER